MSQKTQLAHWATITLAQFSDQSNPQTKATLALLRSPRTDIREPTVAALIQGVPLTDWDHNHPYELAPTERAALDMLKLYARHAAGGQTAYTTDAPRLARQIGRVAASADTSGLLRRFNMIQHAPTYDAVAATLPQIIDLIRKHGPIDYVALCIDLWKLQLPTGDNVHVAWARDYASGQADHFTNNHTTTTTKETK